MKRPALHQRAATVLLCLASLGVMSTLGGCGPGTGGTGIGGELSSVNLGPFSAQPASVCGTPFAILLACTATANGAASGGDPTLQGTVLTNFSDAARGGDISVAIEANSIQLESPCKQIRFEGDWGIAALNDARFFGRFTTAQSATPAPGTLSVETMGASGASLAVTVRQADGRIVLGPVVLERVLAQAAQAAICP